MKTEFYGKEIIRTKRMAYSIAERIVDNLPFKDDINGVFIELTKGNNVYVFNETHNWGLVTTQFSSKQGMISNLTEALYKNRKYVNQKIKENND